MERKELLMREQQMQTPSGEV